MVCQEQRLSSCCRTALTPRHTNLSRHHVWYACATLRPDKSCVCFLVGTNFTPAALTSGSRITAHARSAEAMQLKVDRALDEHAFLLPTRMTTRSGTTSFSFLILFFFLWRGLHCVADTFEYCGVCQEFCKADKMLGCGAAKTQCPLLCVSLFFGPILCPPKLNSGIEQNRFGLSSSSLCNTRGSPVFCASVLALHHVENLSNSSATKLLPSAKIEQSVNVFLVLQFRFRMHVCVGKKKHGCQSLVPGSR